jgi:hypothetical protein
MVFKVYEKLWNPKQISRTTLNWFLSIVIITWYIKKLLKRYHFISYIKCNVIRLFERTIVITSKTWLIKKWSLIKSFIANNRIKEVRAQHLIIVKNENIHYLFSSMSLLPTICFKWEIVLFKLLTKCSIIPYVPSELWKRSCYKNTIWL